MVLNTLFNENEPMVCTRLAGPVRWRLRAEPIRDSTDIFWFMRTILIPGLELATMLLGFDLQGAITLIAGLLLALITLFTGYDHVHFFWGPTFWLNQQIGVFVLAASLAPLVVEIQLASRRRARDQRDRAQAADETARERDRAARASQLQARALRAGALVWLDPTPLHRRWLFRQPAQLIATAVLGGER